MTEQLDVGLSLAPFDWAIVAVLAISTLMSLRRGFLKEALSLGTWIAAFVVARQFHEPMELLLEIHIVDSLMRSIAPLRHCLSERYWLERRSLFAGALITQQVCHPQIVC